MTKSNTKYKYFLLMIGLTLIFTFSSRVGSAQEAVLEKSSILIGDQINITLSIPSDAGKNILFPDISEQIIDGIELVSVSEIDTSEDLKLQQNLLITSFEDSTFLIPGFSFIVDNDSIKTNPLQVEVKYFIPEKNFNKSIDSTKSILLSDIKTVIQTPLTFEEFIQRYGKISLMIVAILLIVALAVILIIRFNKNKSIFTPEKPKLPPDVIALNKLRELKEGGSPKGEQIKIFYDKLSGILREYIEERYHIPATDFITSQIISALQTLSMVKDKQTEQMQSILFSSDMVKFAKHRPEEFVIKQNLQSGFDFVEKTKEKPEAKETSSDRPANTKAKSKTTDQ